MSLPTYSKYSFGENCDTELLKTVLQFTNHYSFVFRLLFLWSTDDDGYFDPSISHLSPSIL